MSAMNLINKSTLRILCLLFVGLVSFSHSASPNSVEAKAGQEALVLGVATENIRLGIIAKKPVNFLHSIFEKIADGVPLARKLDEKQITALGDLFVTGSIPFVLPNSTVAFYNPYCDTALVFNIDTHNDTAFEIKSSFAVGGDTLSNYFNRKEKGIAPTELNFVKLDFAQRVEKRSVMLYDALRTNSVDALHIEIEQQENHERLLNRYLSLVVGQTDFSDVETRAVVKLTRMLSGGEPLASNSYLIFDTATPTLSDTNLLGDFRLVFSGGPAQERVYFLIPTKNPTLLVRIIATVVSGKVHIKKVGIQDLKPPSNS